MEENIVPSVNFLDDLQEDIANIKGNYCEFYSGKLCSVLFTKRKYCTYLFIFEYNFSHTLWLNKICFHLS